MPATSTPSLPASVTLLQEQINLVAQSSQGPSLSEVAADVLRTALKQQYPTLDIDPDQTLIISPRWQAVDDTLQPLPPHLDSLTFALMRQGEFHHIANFIEGEQFLTVAPLTDAPVHLAVSIEDIADTLNDYAPVLFNEFEQRQLDFWNESIDGLPRWRHFSRSLRKALNVDQVKGWDADQCTVARAVSTHPDKAERATQNTDIPGIQACLIDIDYNEPDNTRHLLLGGAIVLKARIKQRDLVMLYTIEGGYEAFDSLEKLGDSLPERIDMDLTEHTLQWRLFEPDGDIFDHMAWTLIGAQIDAIKSLASTSASLTGPTLRSIDSHVVPVSSQEQKHIDQLKAAIPDWLSQASPADLQDYGRYLSNQGRLRDTAKGNAIPLIDQYAQEKMRDAILADRRKNNSNDADTLALDELQITVTNSFTAGAFTLPDPRDKQVETLGEFALQNTPPYSAELRFKNGPAVPAWLTVEYLSDLAKQVDVGAHYPLLLKKNLIDDSAQASLEKQRYSDLLPDLLRLEALECKLRKTCGVDETGYRYICELMDIAQGNVSNILQTVVIRPLTFIPKHRLLSTGDTVANMFIIGPRQAHDGPCLLYRPLLEQPLLQFASVQNMIYALHQPGDLRESVLAWLPTPALSFEYAQYVFPVGLPSPWLATQSGIETLLNLDLSGPIALGTEDISSDLLGTLFNSNAGTVIEKADRQSLSNGERRWALLKDSGLAIFSVASTFLTGPIGTAVWVWQAIGELQQGLDAHERGDSLVEWSSLGDVLMALGMVLIHQASIRRKTAEASRLSKAHKEPLSVNRAPPALPSPESTTSTFSLDPVVLTGELPAHHTTALELAESVPHRTVTALGVYLDSVKVSAPDLTSKELNTLNETPPHLYQLNDKQYAKVGTRWFEVIVDDDEQVLIFNRKTPTRSGPMLTHDQRGHWYVDTRLRLRGGGPKSRLKHLKQVKEARRAELETQVNAFKAQEAEIKAELDRLQKAMLDTDTERHADSTRLYMDKLEELIKSHTQALEQLNEWRALGGKTGYTYTLLRLTTLLEKHLTLWFILKKNQYSQAIKPFIDNAQISSAEPVGDHRAAVTRAIALGNDIIERLTLADTYLRGLEVLGRAGRTEAGTIKKLLPRYSAQDLKANEIGISYELCVQEQADPLMPQARAAVADILGDASKASHEVADLMRQQWATGTPDERIAKLSGLADIYADVLQRILDLPSQYPEMIQQVPVDHVQALIVEFQALVNSQLEALLPEAPVVVEQEKPAPAAPGPSRHKVKVSKTRPREPQPESSQKPDEPTLQKVILAQRRLSKPVLSNLDTISEALNLNLETEGFITRTNKDALRPGRIPADIQDLFDQQALKLEETADLVDTSMSNIQASGGSPPPVATLSEELRDRAIQLRTKGLNIRTTLLKKRKPRQAYFQWLHDNAQVSVLRSAKGRIRTKERHDYFQEYRIIDASGDDLWLAHFHYDALDSPAQSPTAAHLKVSEKYLETLTPELRQELTTLLPLDYVLRRISDPLTQAIFLSLEPKA